MTDDEVLVKRARIAAGCAWNSKPGETSNQTEPQEPEVRRILRECADRMEALTQAIENAGMLIKVHGDGTTYITLPPIKETRP